MYSIFASILGISQVAALIVFPFISKYVERKSLYAFSTILVVIGYIIFFFAPTTRMLYIGLAGILIFIGEACIQLMMLMFLADSVEYGQWKWGKCKESISFSLQPFINKIGVASASGMVISVVIVSGIKEE